MTIDIDRIDALAKAATPGPWSWFGNTKTKEIYLATVDHGRQYVMDFVRWGMGHAQPRFQQPDHLMHKAADLIVYERDYRKDFHDINNADARFIAACDPTTIRALIAEVRRLRAVARLESLTAQGVRPQDALARATEVQS